MYPSGEKAIEIEKSISPLKVWMSLHVSTFQRLISLKFEIAKICPVGENSLYIILSACATIVLTVFPVLASQNTIKPTQLELATIIPEIENLPLQNDC